MESYLPKYCDAHSILLVRPTGALRKLYCPFGVVCMQDIGELKEGMHLWVAEVCCTRRDELLYSIFDNPKPLQNRKV
jgi:hypothetical protein